MNASNRLNLVTALYDQLSQWNMKDFTELGRGEVPSGGVYFFFEPGEIRSDSGRGPRVVRVGTHALTETSKATLWQRLSQHRGNATGSGGNHRGSIFRLLVGDALRARRPELSVESWGRGSSAPREIVHTERELEARVSGYIARMPLVWLAVPDRTERDFIERNAIALLSNYKAEPAIDPPSDGWLGLFSSRERVRRSGLWNNNHVDAECDERIVQMISTLL